ncbi:MAG: hypothetical protein OIF57_09670 [Marinobacterium sp.]|nr:hypothetical protein [Marinobacterium sp.]
MAKSGTTPSPARRYKRQQAIWCFEMRDAAQPQVLLGSELQLNIIEMKKADRLHPGNDTLSAWITFFEHWQEDTLMANVSHPPVQNALNRIRQLSADEKAQRRAFVRERALHDKVTLMREAREEGIAQGLELGIEKGLEQGVKQGSEQTESRIVCAMLDSGMSPEVIAEMLKMPLADVLNIYQGME